MSEPAWVEEFIGHLRRTAHNGRVNVRLSAQLVAIYRERAYRFRQTEEGARLRDEWAKAVESARLRRLSHSR